MAEKRSKFAALADLTRAEPEVIEEAGLFLEPERVFISPTDPGFSKVRGRPATGKRSNPEWKLYSHYLKRKTQRAVVAKLQAEDGGRDLSDVLEELLEQWLRN